MCDGVSEATMLMYAAGAMAATSAATTVASVQAQQQQADAKNKQNEAQYETTMATYANNNAQSNLQGQQLREQTMQKIAENNIAAQKGIGKATAASGVTGVGGNSVGALLGDLEGSQARYNNSVETNYNNGVASIENQRQNSWSSAASTINGLNAAPLPDYLSAGLKIANAGADYAFKSSSIKTPKNEFSMPLV